MYRIMLPVRGGLWYGGVESGKTQTHRRLRSHPGSRMCGGNNVRPTGGFRPPSPRNFEAGRPAGPPHDEWRRKLERYFEYEVPASVQEACTEIRMRLPSGLIEDYSVLDAEGDEVPFRCERASGAAPEGRDPVLSPPPGQPAYRTGKLSR